MKIKFERVMLLQMKKTFQDRGLTLLPHGTAAFSRILALIDSAKRSIYINIFVWRDDFLGNQLAQKLLNAANRGVKITIVKDKLGMVFEKAEQGKQSFFNKTSWGMWPERKFIENFYFTEGEASNARQRLNPLYDQLQDHPLITLDTDRFYRDHSKFYIFDERVIIMGGMNVGDEYVGPDVSGVTWDDYMVEIDGADAVDRLWSVLNGEAEINFENQFDYVANTRRKKNRFEIAPAILQQIATARESIEIEMAYWGDRRITRELIDAIKRGVKIVITFPLKANLQNDLNYKVVQQLYRHGAEVYFYKNMLHAKAMVFDKKRALLGSANLNRKSMNSLSELDLYLNHLQMVESLRMVIKSHRESSRAATNFRYSKIRAWLEGLIC